MGSIRKHGQTGALFFDFRYEGARCREYTTLPDTAANKKKMEKVLKMLEADIAAGTFDYRRYFPASKNAARFDAAPAVSVAVTVSTSSVMVDLPATFSGEKVILIIFEPRLRRTTAFLPASSIGLCT